MQDPNDFYDAEESSKCLRFLRLLWKFCRCIFSHVTLVSLVVAYCVLGAYAFESLEAEHEIQVKDSIKYVRSNVTERIWIITETSRVLIQENWTDRVVTELNTFEKELLEKMKKDGWDGSEEMKNIQWTFAGALFYSIIVITTIGYGHIAPKTQNGKVVTIFYAILGIPLMLLCLSNIGDVMASSFRFLYWKICCYVCTRPPKPPRSHRHVSRSQSRLRQSGRYARSTIDRRSVRVATIADSSLPPPPPLGVFSENNIPFRSDCSRYARTNSENAAFNTVGRLSSPVRSPTIDESSSMPSTSPRYRRSEAEPIAAPSKQYHTAAVWTRSLDRKCHSTANVERIPVLFNKYAMDESDGRQQPEAISEEARPRRTCSSSALTHSRRCRSVERSSSSKLPTIVNSDSAPAIEMTHRPAVIRRPRGNVNRSPFNKREAPSARIMSPMGLAVHRQIYADDRDYDYFTNNGVGVVEQEPDDPSSIKPVPIWLCVFLVVSYILGGAFLFAEWETWPYLDSAYFCFITLTTIGFGDLVPAHRLNAHQGIALCSLYLLFGIALLAMSFNLVQEEVINNVKNVAKRLGIIKDEHGGELNDEFDDNVDGNDDDDFDDDIDDDYEFDDCCINEYYDDRSNALYHRRSPVPGFRFSSR